MTSLGAGLRNDRVGVVAALGGLLATIATGLACVGPLLAIMLGVGGLGWLTRYSSLRVPAGVISLLLVGIAFYSAYRRRDGDCRAPSGRRRLVRMLCWLALGSAVAVNAFEFLLFDHLF